jgi:uncharacterized protein (DUF736 family)
MQIIGSATKTDDTYTGALNTMNHNVKIRLVPNEGASENAPDYRVYADAAEIGAGWKKTSSTGLDFVSVKLDDPGLANPIYASLYPTDQPGEFNLLWSRPKSN